MAKPNKPMLMSDIFKALKEWKKEHKKFPIGSFRLNPQGKIIPDPQGSITIKEKEKKEKKISSVKISSSEKITKTKKKIEKPSKLELPKNLICSKCKKKINASKDRIKKLADKGKLDSYICRSCK